NEILCSKRLWKTALNKQVERKIAEYGSVCINTGIAGLFTVGKIKGRTHILPHFNTLRLWR
ncbi:hypothetical protein, partial [Faecalibacillus intestinalis]|uniref:hypothetical protein n=1 Tax=Faecalibacillus intestinalis TaxID=1982626 RepID=UPI00295EA4FF